MHRLYWYRLHLTPPPVQPLNTSTHPVVSLWPGHAPGAEGAAQVEKETPFPGSALCVVRNVVKPTLSVHLPAPARATGTGVIVAPGGGFRFLSMGAEGHDVAAWLVERGIAAFVLKYRTVETPESDAELWVELQALLAGAGKRPFRPAEDAKPGIADGVRAMEVVRAGASKWGVSPDRIGFIGFSAGAIVASQVALQAPEAARPNFVAPIYGAPDDDPAIPKGMPPVFLACSSDDSLMSHHVLTFHAALRRAGHHPDLRMYRDGGHGYGMNKQGKSSDCWIDDLYGWLSSLGVARKIGAA